VYLDNFIGMVQGSWTHCRHINRVLLHNLDKVFCPLDHLNNEHLQKPAFIKKMKKGNVTWLTQKIVLGWIIDTVRRTIEFPVLRLTRLFELLHSITPASAASALISGNSWRESSALWSSSSQEERVYLAYFSRFSKCAREVGHGFG
jgi:hypothetical protein